MRKLASIMFGTLLMACGAGAASAQNAQNAGGGAARAQEVLRQARAALGGEAKLGALKGLSATGKFRRVIQNQEQAGEVEFLLMTPDKYRKTETFTAMAGVEVTVIMAVSGEQAWTDTKTFAGGAGVSVVRAGANDAAVEAAKQAALRAEFARNFVMWLLAAPSPGVQFTHVGEAEADGARADIIGVSGPNNLALQLFIDQKTHRPLMLTYKGRVPKAPTAVATTNEAQAKEMAAKAMAQLQEVEVRIFLTDYRAADGVMLPHNMSKEMDGAVIEEVEIKGYKVNPPLTAQKFEKN